MPVKKSKNNIKHVAVRKAKPVRADAVLPEQIACDIERLRAEGEQLAQDTARMTLLHAVSRGPLGKFFEDTGMQFGQDEGGVYVLYDPDPLFR